MSPYPVKVQRFSFLLEKPLSGSILVFSKIRKINILLAEDDHADIFLIKEAFKCHKADIRLTTADNGEEVLSYLEYCEITESSEFPDLMIIDLNMPKMGGIEVLKKIKQTAHFKSIPVIILSTSRSPLDIKEAYKYQADLFKTKPINWNDFKEVIGEILDYYEREFAKDQDEKYD